MQKIMNYLRGNIRVEVTCPYPERFINLCAQSDVEFWNLKRVSPTAVNVTLHIRGYRILLGLSESAGFSIRPLKESGVPFTLMKVRKRHVLLAGLVICLLAVWTMSFFVWEIDVSGNENVSSQEILKALDETGFGIGSFGPSVSSESLSNKMLLKIPELSWFAINVRGSHADVLVRERVPVPKLVDEKAPTMVCASKSGIITKMSVLQGNKLCKVGDTILKGDVIVTGVMDSKVNGKRLVHAMAEVYARTWYELSAKMPLETSQKQYIGKTVKKTALVIAGKRINFYFNSRIPWSDYDKIISEKVLSLPSGNVLPLSVVTEKYSGYTPVDRVMSESDAEAILKESLLTRLKSVIGDGETLKTDFTSSTENGVITVTLNAECSEQIAAERAMTAEEIASAEEPAPSPDATN